MNTGIELQLQLEKAAAGDNLHEVKNLVEERGADVAWDHSEALRCACHNGHLEIVKYLVAQGADMFASTIDRDSPIKMSKQEKHEHVFKYLKEVAKMKAATISKKQPSKVVKEVNAQLVSTLETLLRQEIRKARFALSNNGYELRTLQKKQNFLKAQIRELNRTADTLNLKLFEKENP